jgi:hypothetical protein
MMVRSTTRSNQRPDTLMQDRICQVDETSCNARPDHTLGHSRRFRDAEAKAGSAPITDICRQHFSPLHRAVGVDCAVALPFACELLCFGDLKGSSSPTVVRRDRKALQKELVQARAMTRIFVERSQEKRRVGERGSGSGQPWPFAIFQVNGCLTSVAANLALPILRMRRFSYAPVGDTKRQRLDATVGQVLNARGSLVGWCVCQHR